MKPNTVALALAVLVVAAGFGTWFEAELDPVFPPVTVKVAEPDAAINRYSKLLTFRTVADTLSENHVNPENEAEFANLLSYIEKTWPNVFSKLKVEKVNKYSLLITWQGAKPDLNPVLFISHLDVVPVPGSTESNWTHPPFSGTLADGYVWGRGAMDLKLTVGAILEALQQATDGGFRPDRTLLVAIGHDEEIGGSRGAGAIAGLLKERGVQLAASFDEGSGVMNGFLPPSFRDAHIALVAVLEKGYASFDVRVDGGGGHSSMPPPPDQQPAIALAALATAAARKQPAPRLLPPAAEFLKKISPLSRVPPLRALLSAAHHPWVGAALARLLPLSSPQLEWVFRTTCACTGIDAMGAADNAMPQGGLARFNCRLLPGDDQDTISAHLLSLAKRVTSPRLNLTVKPIETGQGVRLASRISSWTTPQYAQMRRAIQDVFGATPGADGSVEGGDGKDGRGSSSSSTAGSPTPPLVVAPFPVAAGTDSKHYQVLFPPTAAAQYRFLPLRMNKRDVERVHATDERASTGDYLDAVRYYLRLMQLVLGPDRSE